MCDCIHYGLARDIRGICVRWTPEANFEERFRVRNAWNATPPVTYKSDYAVKQDLIQKASHGYVRMVILEKR